MAELYLDEDVTAGVLHLPITYAYRCHYLGAGLACISAPLFIYSVLACLCCVTLLDTPKLTPKPKLHPQGCHHVPIHALTVAVVLLLRWIEYD